MKDIFIDNNIANKLRPPFSDEYKIFIDWLLKTGTLVVSQKLLNEYSEGLRAVATHKSLESILGILGKLQADGRLNKIQTSALNAYVFPKKMKLTCNYRDRDHLKTVLLSFRKIAITEDKSLHYDINNHPKLNKIKPAAAFNPSSINYF